MKDSRAACTDTRIITSRRRTRLLDRLHSRGIDGAIITDARDIMYFTGATPAAPAPACLLIRPGGQSVLVCGDSDAAHEVDEVHMYPWHIGGTILTETMTQLVDASQGVFGIDGGRIGVQRDSASAMLLAAFQPSAWMPIDGEIIDLERTKDEMSLAGVVGAIQANLGAYDAVREAIKTGATELDVYVAGCRGATMRAGHKVLHDGDYRSGAMNGPARNRTLEAGELYIVDAWTMRSGYWSDLSRVFTVSERPSVLQRELMDHVEQVHERVRPLLKPGTTGDELWRAIDSILREHPALRETGLPHHGGHGVGIRIHEPPDINPGVTDVLRAGDVICVEPGGYTAAARAGVRIEDTYLITDAGAECLSRTRAR